MSADAGALGALTGLDELYRLARSPTACAAASATQAALSLLLLEVRPNGMPSLAAEARAAALRDLVAAVAVLTGDDVGLSSVPARYDTGDRETLDRIRDLLGDRGFAAGCLFNVVKYLDRAGKKGPADRDEAKALFYLQAAAHVLIDGYPDPRSVRPRFLPYVRNEHAHWPTAIIDLAKGLRGPATSPGRALADLFDAYRRASS